MSFHPQLAVGRCLPIRDRTTIFLFAVFGFLAQLQLAVAQAPSSWRLPSSSALRSPKWLGEVLSGEALGSSPSGTSEGDRLSSLDDMEAKLLKLRGESASSVSWSSQVSATSGSSPALVAESGLPAPAFEQHGSAAVPGRAALGQGSPASSFGPEEETDLAAVRLGSGTPLSAIRSSEALLTAQNAELRTQLRRWQSSAAAAKAASARASGLAGVTGASGESGQSPQSLGLLGVRSASQSSLLEANTLRLFAFFVVVNAVLFLLWRINQEGGGQGALKQGRPGDSWVQRVLRAIGYGPCDIELSEMQIGNLGAGGEVLMTLHVDGNEQCTGISERPAAGLVRFKDSFSLLVNGSGSASQMCTFAVRNANSVSQESVATLALSTKEIMRRVRSKHGQQYFNFNLTMHEQLAHDRPGGCQAKPQLALRLREIPASKFGRSTNYES